VHYVDFNGAQNFGSTLSWLALYPIQKESHKEAYQFFIRFSSEPKAGLMAGGTLKESLQEGQPKEQLAEVTSYEEVVSVLRDWKEEIVQLNKEPRNYYKFSPGSQAVDWEWFRKEERIGVGYKDLEMGDITDAESRQKLNKIAGLEEDSKSNDPALNGRAYIVDLLDNER
jgi:5-methylcytosine-specific restriction protein B